MKHVLGVVLIAVTSFPAFAHHNWAALYDVEGDIEIEGVISSIAWRNPHVRISFSVNKGTDDEKIYTTESNSVAALTRMGVTKEVLSVGTKVKVAGYPSRTEEGDLFMNHMLMPDGKEIVFARTAEPRWPDAKRIGNTDVAHGKVVEEDFSKRPTSIFAVWSTIFGAEGSHRSLKHPADRFVIEYAEARGTGNCVSKDVWTQMGAPYPIQLIDNGEIVVIHAEEHDTIRTVHMNIVHNEPGDDQDALGVEHAGTDPVKNNLGYSTGRWVGETLLVATTFEGSDSAIQMQESFTLSADHSRLNYSQIIIDPMSNDLPLVNHKWWEYIPGSFVQPYDCL